LWNGRWSGLGKGAGADLPGGAGGEVLRSPKKLDLCDKNEVEIVIRESFSKLLEEVGAVEAKEDVDLVLQEMRTRNYYE
jgi:hypothetical protein